MKKENVEETEVDTWFTEKPVGTGKFKYYNEEGNLIASDKPHPNWKKGNWVTGVFRLIKSTIKYKLTGKV